ncbi:MAG: GntR family transcriptional regulator [Brachybacterium tyrofermentans]
MAIRRQVLRDEVEELILQRLLESRWAPGSRLSIDGLARDLEVSPTPVREAMVSLERSGLVEYVALRGYVVAPMLDGDQITELLAARKIIELAVLDRAFEHWDDLLADLEAAQAHHAEIIERIDAAEQTSEVSYELVHEHFQADWGFHQVLYKHADNRYLAQMFESLSTHTHRMRQTWEGGPLQLDAREAYEEHGTILAKVRQHHHDAALKALADHLDAVLVRSIQTSEVEAQATTEIA